MQKVDAEIRRIIDEQYALARKLIEENRDKIEAMTKALLEWETIDSEQIKAIMENRPPRPLNHRSLNHLQHQKRIISLLQPQQRTKDPRKKYKLLIIQVLSNLTVDI